MYIYIIYTYISIPIYVSSFLGGQNDSMKQVLFQELKYHFSKKLTLQGLSFPLCSWKFGIQMWQIMSARSDLNTIEDIPMESHHDV